MMGGISLLDRSSGIGRSPEFQEHISTGPGFLSGAQAADEFHLFQGREIVALDVKVSIIKALERSIEAMV